MEASCSDTEISISHGDSAPYQESLTTACTLIFP